MRLECSIRPFPGATNVAKYFLEIDEQILVNSTLSSPQLFANQYKQDVEKKCGRRIVKLFEIQQRKQEKLRTNVSLCLGLSPKKEKKSVLVINYNNLQVQVGIAFFNSASENSESNPMFPQYTFKAESPILFISEEEGN